MEIYDEYTANKDADLEGLVAQAEDLRERGDLTGAIAVYYGAIAQLPQESPARNQLYSVVEQLYLENEQLGDRRPIDYPEDITPGIVPAWLYGLTLFSAVASLAFFALAFFLFIQS